MPPPTPNSSITEHDIGRSVDSTRLMYPSTSSRFSGRDTWGPSALRSSSRLMPGR